MSNTIKIKRGAAAPSTSNLVEYELGFSTDNGVLYINNNGTISPLGNTTLGATTIIPVSNGGTGATSASGALSNLGAQATITGGATTITSSNLTASRTLISNSSGKVAVSAVTSTELGYLDGVTSNVQTQLNGKAASSHTHTTSQITDILNKIYPVGSIYMSTQNVSPASILGGTWTSITDKFLLAAGSTYTAGQTGGAATVQLTVDEMPSHRHYNTIEMLAYYSGNGTTANYSGSTWNWIGGFNSGYTGGGRHTTTFRRISQSICGKEPHKKKNKTRSIYSAPSRKFIPWSPYSCKGVG